MSREINRFPHARCGPNWVGLALILVLAGSISAARSAIDSAIDQEVWKMLYGVTDAQSADSAWLARDDDGDGISNGEERSAGTNPFSRSSYFALSSMARNVSVLSFTVPTAVGKNYLIESTTNLAAPSSWAPLSLGVPVAGTGAPVTLTATVPTGARIFYRVGLRDVDADGDGVSNWAEAVSGFDPTTAHTQGAVADDHSALADDLAQENVVTVVTTEATATQPVSGTATDTASISLVRGGSLHLSPTTVSVNWTGTAVAGQDYTALPTSVTFPAKVGSVPLVIVPKANPGRKTSATVTLGVMPGGSYRLGATRAASALIVPAGSLAGTGLTGTYYNGTKATVTPYNPTVLFSGTPALTRVDPTLDFNWNSGSPGGSVAATYFGARWLGQIQPQYSETYYFDVYADDGAKLWVNGQLIIDSWVPAASDRIGSITLQAGVLYDIKLEYFQLTGGDRVQLSWYSESQTKQIVPAGRLYPVSVTPAPPAITSAPSAVGYATQPFSFQVTASTSGGSTPTFAIGAGSGGLPPGLTLNTTTGVISGSPTTVGDYQVALTATNSYGTGAAVLDIQIMSPGNGVTRELWQNLSGPAVANIPLTSKPTSTDSALTARLEDVTKYANNTGERLRGYLTVPESGNYYFWLAANNAAELWISDDAEPVNLIRRAWVTSPGTSLENWQDAGQPHQRSAWLALVAGERYYYEVLHNCGAAGSTSHVSVGSLLDPTGAAASPAAGAAGVVPGYQLTKYDFPASLTSAGTLYVTNLSPQAGAVSDASGSATIRLNASKTQALLHFNYSGLSSAQTSYAIYGPDNNGADAILFDLNVIDKFRPDLKTADGGYIWNIADTSAVSAATIVRDIQLGQSRLKVETVKNPAGEIRGNFFAVLGSQEPPAPVPDPGFTNDSGSDAGAARFLNQAAYGAAPTDLAAVKARGYSAWITSQLALPVTHLLPDVNDQASRNTVGAFDAGVVYNAWWRAAVTAPDQLRHRVAFALSEIMVVSSNNQQLNQQGGGLASYYDTLLDNAFGNFRDVLESVTLHPVMGYWLNMQGNAKGNLATGYHPNENYAREVVQLFSIGLNRLWPDGTLVLNSQGNPVPTYDQDVITNGFARVFTGWNWHQPLQSSGQLPTNFGAARDYINPMVMVKNYHELGPKTLLNHVVLPPPVGYNPAGSPVPQSQADSATAAYDQFCLQDLDRALDNIFYHPNVGPFICRQLIQRLVQSNPSPAYLQRVVQKFNDDGSTAHVRGNMAAVIKAILLDGEVRNASIVAASTTSGKQREPFMRIAAPARTFLFSTNTGTFTQSGSEVITITTSQPHRLAPGDSVSLNFTGNTTGNPPVRPVDNPTTAGYTVLASPAPTANTFSVNSLGLAIVGYSQAAASTTLTVNMGGLAVNDKVYLKFKSGGGADGVYTVTGVPDNSHCTVTTLTAPTAALSGTVIIPKSLVYFFISRPSGSTASQISMATAVNTNLKVGDHFWAKTSSLYPLGTKEWSVASSFDERHFLLANTEIYKSITSPQSTVYPLVAPAFTRSGSVVLSASKFDMGGTNGQLAETPLNATTVFNFYYPDYQYPGSLSANNVTTPEFELTTDTNIVNLSNTIASTILASGSSTGLSNFKNGAIYLDLGPYMTAPYASVSATSTTSGTKVTQVITTTVDATALVSKLSDLLTGGMLSKDAKTTIVGFLNNPTAFPPTTTVIGTTASPPPAPTLPSASARDKARAAVQAILLSPEYAIQL